MSEKVCAFLIGLFVVGCLVIATVAIVLEGQPNQCTEKRFTALEDVDKSHQEQIDQLKKELAKRIGAAGNTAGSAALSNDEIVQIYADNEAEISKLWVEMAETNEDVTLGDAVRAWLKKTKGE